jgi:hypothetical protein
MSAATQPGVDVQFRRVGGGGFAATCGTKTAMSYRSVLCAARAAAASHFQVAESRIEIEVDRAFVTASLKPTTGGAK